MLKDNNQWPYLNLPIFLRRYEIIKNFLKTTQVVEIGTTLNSLQSFIPAINLTTVDILGSNKNEPKWQHFRTNIKDFEIHTNGKKYEIISLGHNCITTDITEEQSIFILRKLVELISDSRLAVLEYPLRFWPAKVENEFLIGLLANEVIYEEIIDYKEVENTIPSHASLRRLVIFKPKKVALTIDEEIKFINLRFPNFIKHPENTAISGPIIEPRFINQNNLVKVFKLKNWTMLVGFAWKWNYITSYQAIENLEQINLNLMSIFNKSSLGLLEGENLVIERIDSKFTVKYSALLRKNEFLLIRANFKSGPILTLVKSERMRPQHSSNNES